MHQIRYVDLPEARVRVKVAGKGPRAIVFTPDPPNVIEHYDALYRALESDLRVICYEMPGFGLSVPSRGYRFTLEENAKFVVDLLAHLGEGPCVLALSCVAGLAGVLAARSHPEVVSHVVAIQTPSLAEELGWANRVDPRRIVRTRGLGQLLLALGKRRIARSWYRVALGSQDEVPAYLDVALRAFDVGAKFSLADGLQALDRADAGALGPVTQPSLCLWGTRDRTHRRTDRRSTLTYLPDARFVEMDDAGHFPELEQPARFRAELLRFLGER